MCPPCRARLPSSVRGSQHHQEPQHSLLGPQNHTPQHLVGGQVLSRGQGSEPGGHPAWGQHEKGSSSFCVLWGSEPAQPFRLLRIENLLLIVPGLYRQQLGCLPPCRTHWGFSVWVGGLLPISTVPHAGHHVPWMLPHKALRCLPRPGKTPV